MHPVKKGRGEIPQVEKGKASKHEVKDDDQVPVNYEKEFKMMRRELREFRDQTVDILWEADTFSRGTFEAFIGRINRILQKYEGK